jgi:hypothetical protein
MASPVAIDTAPSVSAGSAQSRTPSGLLLRLRTRVRRPHLDAAIARGQHWPGDPALALREAQLVDARQRRRLATRLEEVVAEVARPRVPDSAAPVDRPAVAIASPVLSAVIALLRSPETVEARGMALGWRMLTDPGSSLYEPAERGSSGGARLWRESSAVLRALRPA